MLMASVTAINDVYASAETNSSTGVDLERTIAWQTHYAVNGFVNSGQPDPGQIFKIRYLVLDGAVEEFSMPLGFRTNDVAARVVSDGNGTLKINFPKNYPITNTDDIAQFDVFVGDRTIPFDWDESACFFEMSIPFSGSELIEVKWLDFLTDEPYRGIVDSETCISETLVQDVVRTKDGTIAPLHQVKAGVKPNEVVCGDDFELVMHPNGKPYCASPDSAEVLKERWNIP